MQRGAEEFAVVVAVGSPILAEGLALCMRAAGLRAVAGDLGDAVDDRQVLVVDHDVVPESLPTAAVVTVGPGASPSGPTCVSLRQTVDDLVGAVHAAARGDATPGPVAAPPTPRALLTERERAVVELVIDGRTNQAAADELGISAHTVRTHLQNVMAKLGVRNRRELAARIRGGR